MTPKQSDLSTRVRIVRESAWPAEPKARRFAFMRVFRVVHPDGVYLWRLRLLEVPWFGELLHRLFHADADRHLHDHPWSFASFVLFGWYREETPSGIRKIRWFNFKRASDRHRIIEVSSPAPWTLVFRGPRVRTWGFYTENGWIPWHVYLGVTEKQ